MAHATSEFAMDKYRQWLDAERKAQAAAHELQPDEQPWDPSHPRTPAQEARRLRELADRLFADAMDEMHTQVRKALNRRVRK